MKTDTLSRPRVLRNEVVRSVAFNLFGEPDDFEVAREWERIRKERQETLNGLERRNKRDLLGSAALTSAKPIRQTRGPARFRQQDVTRAIKAAKAAGVENVRVEVDRDGKIIIVQPGTQQSLSDDEWDEVLK